MIKNIFKYFITISKHKFYVLIECWKRGLYWQGIVHDLSKYSPSEFFVSARYFNGRQSPIEREKIANGYSIAWLNHMAKNKHHWQYWIDWEDGKLINVDIPKKYLDEMVCDFIGASKAYLGGKYNPKEPYNYFIKNKEYNLMNKDNLKYIEIELLK